MGARLVSLALQPDWAALSLKARLVFITMCQRSQDTNSNGHPPRTYWGGHRQLAVALAGNEDAVTLRKVRRAIAELTDAGAIEVITPAAGKRQASYLVTPESWQQPELLSRAGTSPSPNGRHPST